MFSSRAACLPEMLLNLVVSRDPAFVADYTAQNVRFDYRQKQVLLEELHPCRRLEMLIEMLNHELNVMSIEQELNEATNEQVNRSQRDYYLREQMKIIQQELGEDDSTDDIGEYRQKIRDLKLSQGDRREASQGGFASCQAAVWLDRGNSHPRLSRCLP